MINKQFVDIKGFNGRYQINRLGEVLSLSEIKPKLLLSQKPTKSGYLRVSLYSGKKLKHYPVHKLVAHTFIPNPYSKPFIKHKDGNKQNNCVDNLEWCGRGEM